VASDRSVIVVCCDKVQLSDTGWSVGIGQYQKDATGDGGNSLFDLAAAVSAAVETPPGTQPAPELLHRPCNGSGGMST